MGWEGFEEEDNEFLFVLCAGKAVWVAGKPVAVLAWGGGRGRAEGGGKGETGTCTVGEWGSKHLEAKTLFRQLLNLVSNSGLLSLGPQHSRPESSLLGGSLRSVGHLAASLASALWMPLAAP